MAENTSDSDIDLKKRARRRLVGAVALALLAAVVLPIVMDSKPRPPAQDIQVRIPSQDAGSFASRVGVGAPVPTPLPSTPPAAAVDPQPTQSVPDAAPPADASAPVSPPAVSVPPAAVPVPTKPAVIPHDTKPADAKHDSKTPSKPDAKKLDAKPNDAKSAETLRAEKILAGGDAPEAKSDAPWVLQLGAYAELGNAKVLQAKLKELGYPSYTEKVATPHGDRIRVRAGPFSSKAAAEKAQAALKKIGAGGPPGGVLAQK
ncbi:MAG TPA: SPOR domain-containing protein [Rhodocyclaceae bacterium]|jgi:DedD protein|nr:SPOR domain-containing protein [Rhodocyclaceae bacterium]